MKNFTEFLREEVEYLVEGQGKHLTHLEDLPFSTGDEGIEHAANILDDLNTMLSGKKKANFNAPKAKTFIAGKFDGAPAIIFGRDPETRKFFVASKSAFNKNPKINYTMEDIERNHSDSPGLADKLRQALQYLPTVAPKKGIYQGDFMFDRWSIQKGAKFQEFTPNTITYKVKANSEEGRKAFRAKFGLVVHTKYEGKSLGELEATPYVDTENFGENPDVYFMPAKVEMNPENWKPEDRAEFTNELENAKIKYKRMKDEAFDEVTKQSSMLDLYFNETVRGKTTPDVEGYLDFLERRANKEVAQFKTPTRQEGVRRRFADMIQHVQHGQKHFKEAFELHRHLQKAKDVLMKGIRQNTPDFEYAINGKKTGPEGYVVYRDGQDAVKLVDRKEFSKMNFELAKMKKPTHPLPAIPPVVFAYGRMNPPTGGHEEVVNKVRELANQHNAAHEIVLSGTQEPSKNPLTPEQKVKYAKKFFPGTNIQAATKEAPDFLTHAARLYAAGHREFIMVAGPDRAPEFRKLLAAYNGKTGRHGYYKFDHIQVVTSNRIPGKSGTEMRKFVEKGDFASFSRGLPQGVSPQDAQKLFNDVKKGQSRKPLKEELNELQHIKLYTVAPANLKPGEDLKSMSTQMGSKQKGRAAFGKKWDGDFGPGEKKLPRNYADYVHLTKDPLFAGAMKDFLSQRSGKKMAIYDVRPGRNMPNKPEAYKSSDEASMVKDRIPARYIRKRWDGADRRLDRVKTSSWKRWGVGVKEETIQELSKKTLQTLIDKTDVMPQKDAREMKKVWKYRIWPAKDRIKGKFRTKTGEKKYHTEEEDV